MILAVIPLIPIAIAGCAAAVGGLIGWMNGKSKRKEEELKKQQEKLDSLIEITEEIAKRQQEHEDDLNGVIEDEETGQMAEEIAFGIKKEEQKEDSSEAYYESDIKEKDDGEVDDRFDILDL